MGFFVVVHFLSGVGGSVLNKYKFGNALFEVIGGCFVIIHYRFVCATFHIKGSMANCKSNKSHAYVKIPLFVKQQEGAFYHNSLVCV